MMVHNGDASYVLSGNGAMSRPVVASQRKSMAWMHGLFAGEPDEVQRAGDLG